ncbi:putative melibiase [Blastopirellula marina DSM 3645]|uniref:alpha-galactosidase n=1 Tax=Blastopirellula marina DSM 3645 TaxID=314230 RepID=A3ZQ63_9BACT|nr:putative melibiase [Blastopirellula marina DSM 3645]
MLVLLGDFAAAADAVPLSALDLSQMSSGWSVPKANANIMGKALSIRDKKFAMGIGTHASSRLRLQLGQNALRFRSVIGIDDSAGGQGSVQFRVFADRQLVFHSGTVTGKSPAQRIDLDIAGVDLLELVVDDNGDGSANDHADWADAKLTLRDDKRLPQALAPFETIDLKTASFHLRFVVGDDRRLYQAPICAAEEQLPPSRNQVAYPQGGDGYVWEPALQVVHADGDRSTSLRFVDVERTGLEDEREQVRIRLQDDVYPLQVDLYFRLDPARDVIEEWRHIHNQGEGKIALERMASTSWLFDAPDLHLLHFHGDWADEMNPIAEKLTPGVKSIASLLGTRATQFVAPSFVLSLDGPPQEQQGRVIAGSLAWSGNFQAAFEHNGSQVRALCGVHPFGSTYYLDAGEGFQTPTMIWVSSNRGLGEMSRKFHRWARKHGIRDGDKPRDTLLNNWEATGFDFDQQRIEGLLPPAAEVGFELFLLDDGWFGDKYPRVNDRAGLGDWRPNPKRFPDGMEPIAQSAIEQGMRFGIWIEPEMVNPQSVLYEQHPDWVIRQPHRDLDYQRTQLVLDLTRPEVQQFERSAIQETLKTRGVSCVKWDANRYVTQPGSAYLPSNQQTHLWIDYTNNLYQLMQQTAREFPQTELMLCAGGGGRVDYGALRYFHEFWPSDNTDAVRRVALQWDYSYFFPAISICSHTSEMGNHPLHFATAVSMSARLGMDIDLAELSAEEIATCRSAIAAYKKFRDVIHLGDLHRIESPHDGARSVVNFVSPEKERAILFAYQLKSGARRVVKPQGLDPQKSYRLFERHPQSGRPPVAAEGQSMRGHEWMEQGVRLSTSAAIQATILEFTANEAT